MRTPPPTDPDPSLEDWRIHDELVWLREWGTDRVHALPSSSSEVIVGASPSCTLRLEDASGRVSRRHARLARDRDGGRWSIQDLGSKNGVWLDGARCARDVLEPGVELRLGGITLIAESPRLIALRGYLSRLLGWRAAQRHAVEHALRLLRFTAAGRASLVLCGPEDLVPIAQELHRRALGPERPFVLCDPRRRRAAGTVRAAANLARALPAIAAAAGGSICVLREHLPRDFPEALEILRRPGAHVQLIVCARRPVKSDLYLNDAVLVPPLATRAKELGRIIAEYADDAIARLGAPPGSLTTRDRAWIRRHAASSLAEVEKATLRAIAVRTSGSVTEAAARLGMSRAALASWLRRKREA